MGKRANNPAGSPERPRGDFWRRHFIDALLIAGILLGSARWVWLADTAVKNWYNTYDTAGFVRGALPPEEAAKHRAYYTSDDSTLYLTFDCGYEIGSSTLDILDTLEEYDVPAAFFLLGNFVKRNPDAVRALADSGHIIGSHTMNHPDPADIHSFHEWEEQLTQVELLYEQTVGKPLDKYCRLPEGRFSRRLLRWNEKLGYRTIFWGTTYADWDVDNQPSEEEALDTLLSRLRGGSVILLHNNSSTSQKILGRFIEECRARGYDFGSLDQLAARWEAG